jgi:hypothetical protein
MKIERSLMSFPPYLPCGSLAFGVVFRKGGGNKLAG